MTPRKIVSLFFVTTPFLSNSSSLMGTSASFFAYLGWPA